MTENKQYCCCNCHNHNIIIDWDEGVSEQCLMGNTIGEPCTDYDPVKETLEEYKERIGDVE